MAQPVKQETKGSADLSKDVKSFPDTDLETTEKQEAEDKNQIDSPMSAFVGNESVSAFSREEEEVEESWFERSRQALDSGSFVPTSSAVGAASCGDETKECGITGTDLDDSIELSSRIKERLERNDRQWEFYKVMITDKDELRKLLQTEPDKYKLCQLKIESSHRATAKVLQNGSKFSEIKILGRSKCGQTYMDDEVVVEVLREPGQQQGLQYVSAEPTSAGDEREALEHYAHGQVIGIMKRVNFADVDHPVLFCTLDEIEGHLMKPLCKTVPKVNVRPRQDRFPRANTVQIMSVNAQSELEHERFDYVRPEGRELYIFKVVILGWNKGNIYPKGAVLDVYEGGKDYASGVKVLSMRHRVPRLYPRAVVQELGDSWPEPDVSAGGREDLRDRRVFTIDPPGSQDLDDALSVWNEGGGTVVGVHIADVAMAVAEGCAVDREARQRAVTFYPLQRRPHPMLPEPLSHDRCSLLPAKDRLALSVFFTFDEQGEQVLDSEPYVTKSVVRSCRQFTYKEVQEIIDNPNSVLSPTDTLMSGDIRQLHNIAANLREKRLKKSILFVPFEDPRMPDMQTVADSKEAHALVEEFMILTNFYIARRLRPKFPSLMILRCHTAPDYQQLAEWREKEGAVANLAMKLQGKSVSPDTQLSYQTQDGASPYQRKDVVVQNSLWQRLRRHLEDGDVEEARRIAFMDDLHPLQCLANNHWMDLMKTAQYRCSHGLNQPDHRHFGLGLQYYTHFTSPIRRYADLHVHRLLHAHLDGTAPGCSPDDVMRLCQHINSATARQKAFGKGCLSLRIADSLQRQSLVFRCFVDQVDSEQLTLTVPSLRAVPDRKQELPFSILGVSSQPEVTTDTARKLDTVTVKWKKRIFNKRKIDGYPQNVVNLIRTLDKNHAEQRQAEQKQAGQGEHDGGKILPVVLDINPHYLCVQVKHKDWARILETLAESSDQQLLEDPPDPMPKDQQLLDYMTSERDKDAESVRPRHFSVRYSSGQVLQVQMSAAPSRGVLQPRIDLVHTARNASVCTRHVGEPVLTLTTFARRSTRDQNFKTCASYVGAWMPLLEMEAAYGAGGSDEAFVVEDVVLKLEPDGAPDSTGTVQYRGEFELDSKFCFDRCIDIGGESPDSVRDRTNEDSARGGDGAFLLEKKGNRGFPLDYVCIRYQTKCPGAVLTLVNNYPVPEAVDRHYTWIGHAGIVDAYGKGRSEPDPFGSTTSLSQPSGGHCGAKRAKRRQTRRGQPESTSGTAQASQNGDKAADEEDPIKITMVLCPSCPKPPADLLQKDGATVTLEILPKSEVDRRAQEYLTALSGETAEKGKGRPKLKLAQAIAFGKRIPSLDRDHLALGTLAANHDIRNMPEVKLPMNNEMQQKAIRTALTNSLSLIQGPPGTGKTYTGIKLVYLLCTINRQLEKQGKGKKTILFCGPSNKSVDLVAKLLKKRLGPVCPKIVRMYGSAIETKDYPIPRGNMKQSRNMRDLKSDPELRDVSLHRLIRKRGKIYAERIAEFQKRFENCYRYPQKNKLTSDDIKAYRKLLYDASVKELQEYDVVLTTCAVAGNRKLAEGTKGTIFQVIIDECAMSPEPHSLVPIIATQAKQVVLIGDHKQLRPIITCQAAADLGLNQSLFERLFEKFPEVTVFLDTQYRMHPAICEFPSEQFYDGKLKTVFRYLVREGLEEPLPFWTPNWNEDVIPHILVDVRGEEQTLTVSTDEGNEKSKSNVMEANKVMEILQYLTWHGVLQHNVQVLTQYNAQRHLIEELMKKLAGRRAFGCYWSKEKCKENVTTVVSSQGGEWDYVILSTVRSLPSYKIEPNPTYGWCRQNLGFITDKNQVNVALTRARKGLIIVGNVELLECDEVWGHLVERYESLDCLYDATEFPPAGENAY